MQDQQIIKYCFMPPSRYYEPEFEARIHSQNERDQLKNGDVDDLMSLLKPTCMNNILTKQSEDCMRSFFFYKTEIDQRYTILEVDN